MTGDDQHTEIDPEELEFFESGLADRDRAWTELHIPELRASWTEASIVTGYDTPFDVMLERWRGRQPA